MEPSYVTPHVERPRRVGALVGDSLRRPGGRRVLSLLSVVLLLAGVGMFAYPVGTDLYSKYKQGQLREEFDSADTRAAYVSRTIAVGEGLTRLRIPEIDTDVVVVEGTTPSALRAGAGHYPDTPLPGEVGNVGIAGHRTTYGRPFNRLDELGPGDVATLETPLAVHTYRAVGAFDGHPNPFVVSPDQSEVLLPRGDQRLLTLTTCHPKGSARQRLVMTFRLVKTVDKPGVPLPPKASGK